MEDKLHIYVCEHFEKETEAVLSAGDFADVKAFYFMSRCGRPTHMNKQFANLSFSKTKTENKLFCGCSCLSKNDREILKEGKYKELFLANCFQMFASPWLINKLIKEGAYILTPGWLASWRRPVEQWGDQNVVRELFSETVSKLVLLDTGVEQNCTQYLKEFADYVDRPVETFSIGLDYYTYYLENEILRWRLLRKNQLQEPAEVKPKNNHADYAMALDLTSNLFDVEKESELAQRISEIFQMMFSPKKVSYLSVQDGSVGSIWTNLPKMEHEEAVQRISSYEKLMDATASGQGFYLKIGRSSEPMAIIELDQFVQSERIVDYENLAQALNGVLALAIENCRFKQSMREMNSYLQVLNATKDKLFSIIAHDLKNPFNSILGFSELLTDDQIEIEQEEAEEMIKSINSTARSTLDLLENLLSWARSQTGRLVYNPKEVSLAEVFSDTIEPLRLSSKMKNIAIEQFLIEDFIVDTDANMLKTILRNIISNSIKFTETGGRIIVLAMKKNDSIQVVVSDDGVGMTKELADRLFSSENVASMDGTASEKGSGLGLLLCKDLVEKIGGQIWVESKEGQGTDFKFTLPVSRS